MLSIITSRLIEHGRAAEWLSAIVLAGFAITLALPGDSLAPESYRVFREMGFDEVAVATPLALLAAGRLAALYINGAWRRSPFMRLIGAVAGTVIFFMLSAAFAWPFLTGSAALSTGASTYLVLALFDALAAYRSGADARLASIIRG